MTFSLTYDKAFAQSGPTSLSPSSCILILTLSHTVPQACLEAVPFPILVLHEEEEQEEEQELEMARPLAFAARPLVAVFTGSDRGSII